MQRSRRTSGRTRRRNQLGGFTTLAFVAMIPLLMALAAFGIDMKHYQTAQQQLQKATDAAALAGAEMLWADGTYSMASNAYTPDSNYTTLKAKALNVAQLNIADGKLVSQNTPGVSINVSVTDPVLPTAPPPILVLPPALQNLNLSLVPPTPIASLQAIFAPTQGGCCGKVKVTATMRVKNMFGGIFGHPSDDITAVSVAGSAGPAYSVNAGQLFPIGVSWLSVPTVTVGSSKILVDVPLVMKRVGDPIVLNINPTGLDQNATFTTFTTGTAASQYVPQAIDQYLGVIPLEVTDQTKVIPPITVGNSITTVSDNSSINELTAQAANISGKVLYMPVFVTSLPLGLAASITPGDVGSLVNTANTAVSSLLGLNQVIGFVAVKVDNVTVSPGGIVTIKGLIVNGQRFGSNKYAGVSLLPALLNSLLSLVGISGGNLLPVVTPGQTYPLTANQAVKLLPN